MLKRIGLFSLLLFATSAAVLPTAAHAQDGYYGNRNSYRSEDRRWRDGDDRRYDRKERERREHEWREHERREHEWRKHRRWEREYERGYSPGSYFYFQYGR